MKKDLATLKEEFQKIASSPELCETAFNAALARDFDSPDDKKDFISFMMSRKIAGMAKEEPHLQKKLAELERIFIKMSHPVHAQSLPDNIGALFTSCIHAAFMRDISIIAEATNRHALSNLEMVLNCATKPLNNIAPFYPASLKNDLLDASVALLNSVERNKLGFNDRQDIKACAENIITSAEMITAPYLEKNPAERKPIRARIVDEQPGVG
jgi:hypothetical protein